MKLTTDKLTGSKADVGKARMDLLPPEFLEGTAQVLTHGASKYGDRNWEGGFKWGRLYGALLRHLNAFWAGEDIDPDSHHPHLDHAACMLAFLRAHWGRNLGEDDRGDLIRFTEEEFNKFADPWKGERLHPQIPAERDPNEHPRPVSCHPSEERK